MKTTQQWMEHVGMGDGHGKLSCMGFVLDVERLIQDIQKEHEEEIVKIVRQLIVK